MSFSLLFFLRFASFCSSTSSVCEGIWHHGVVSTFSLMSVVSPLDPAAALAKSSLDNPSMAAKSTSLLVKFVAVAVVALLLSGS